jgi:hypothetical protein
LQSAGLHYNIAMKLRGMGSLAALCFGAWAAAAPLTIPYQLTHSQNMDPPIMKIPHGRRMERRSPKRLPNQKNASI